MTVKRTTTIPTLVVEERTLLRQGISSLLQNTTYRVVASVASVSEISELRLPPAPSTLAILGIRDKFDETVAAVHSLREIIPDGKVVAISDRYSHFDLSEILNCGVDGVVFNVASGEALLKVFDLAFLGQQVVILDPTMRHERHIDEAPLLAPVDRTTITGTKLDTETGSMTTNTGGPFPLGVAVQLSDRETQVLLRVARGEANKTIARSCSITEATVKAHVKAILRKIAVRNRTQAALWAIERGLLSDRNHAQPNGGTTEICQLIKQR